MISLQRPAPHVEENLEHWDCEGHNKEENITTSHCASCGQEILKTLE